MKKTLLTLVALSATTLLQAQTGAGTIMLGGDFGIRSEGTRTNRTTSPSPNPTTVETKTDGHMNWHFSPTVGYFVADNLAVGLRLNFASDFVERETNGTTTEDVRSFGLGASLFGRKYFPISENFYLFGEVSFGFNNSSYTEREDGPEPNQLVDGNKVTSSGISLRIAPGLAFFPSPKWGIDFTLSRFASYSTSNFKSVAPNNGGESTSKQSFFSAGAGLMPTLGVHYYISR